MSESNAHCASFPPFPFCSFVPSFLPSSLSRCFHFHTRSSPFFFCCILVIHSFTHLHLSLFCASHFHTLFSHSSFLSCLTSLQTQQEKERQNHAVPFPVQREKETRLLLSGRQCCHSQQTEPNNGSDP